MASSDSIHNHEQERGLFIYEQLVTLAKTWNEKPEVMEYLLEQCEALKSDLLEGRLGICQARYHLTNDRPKHIKLAMGGVKY